VWVGKHLSDTLPTKSVLKHGDTLLPVFLNFALEYAIQTVQTNQEGLKVNGNNIFQYMLIMLIYWVKCIL
jgi:hypothetical protein